MAYAKLQLRGDTAANWTSANPVLASREMALEIDTSKFKIGDGVTAWNSLAYGGIAGPGVPAGGTEGQIYAKASSTDYDGVWIDPPEGGGGAAWATIADAGTMVAGTPERVTAAVTRTLPSTIAANDLFTLHAQGGDVAISTPHTIKYAGGTVCSASDTLTIAQGETVYLLANSTSELDII